MRTIAVAASLIAALSGSGALSQAVTLNNSVLKEVVVVSPEGARSTSLTKVGTTVPGNVVVLVMSFANTGKKPATNLVINNSVSKDLVYAGPAVGSSEPIVSVDAGRTWGQLATLRVPGTGGAARPAQMADVTSVRWIVPGPLDPGKSGQVAYRAVVKP